MLVRVADKKLKNADEHPDIYAGYPDKITELFRIRMQQIRAADNENVLRGLKSLHFEKLKGKRQHEYSIRLNNQFRLIFEIEKVGRNDQLVITGIEDCH
jgi:toxin HigB-1